MRVARLWLAVLLILAALGPQLAQGQKPKGGGTPSCPPDRLLFVPANGAELQLAFDCADPGAVITLRAGAANVYEGQFTLRAKPVAYEADGTTPKRITIQSERLAELPADTRVTPLQEEAMAWLRVPPGGSAPVLVTELATLPDRTRRGASHYHVAGIKLFTTHWVSQLVRLGTATESSVSELPRDITFDRSYFAGSSGEGTRQGLVANASDVVVTNSSFKDFKDTANDAQAIVVWNGAGPFHIENNYLEGSGENLMVGGGDPSIPDLVPSDLVIVRNHFVKPVSWTTETSTQRGPASRKKWRVKNLFELKNAERVWVEGNVFENNWVQADQQGFAIVFTVRNQNGGAPWARIRDVTFQTNLVKNSTAGFNVLVTDDTHPSGQLERVAIRDNVLVNIAAIPNTDPGSRAGRLVQILNPSVSIGPIDLTVERNTAFSTREVSFSAEQPTSGFVLSANVVRHNTCAGGNDCGISGDGTPPGNPSLARWFTDPVVTGNLFVDAGHDRSADYPAGNSFPQAVTFRSDFTAGTSTIDPVTGVPRAGVQPDYTVVDAGTGAALGVGADWDQLEPLVERATSGAP